MLSYLGARKLTPTQAERKAARAAQIARHQAVRKAAIERKQAAHNVLIAQRAADKRKRSDEASAKWHLAQEKKREAKQRALDAKAEVERVRATYTDQAGGVTPEGAAGDTSAGMTLQTVMVPIQTIDNTGEMVFGSRESDFDDAGGGMEGLAGLGAKARCRNPAPFYGTIAKYRKACRKAGNTYDRTRCLCVDQYGRVWPYQRQQPVGPQFDPNAYLRQQEFYRQIQAQQLANQQYYLQQQQQQLPYQQPQYQTSFPQGYAANYGSPFPSAFAPGSSGATGPSFTDEAELAASSGGGGDDFGLPADTVLFQGKGVSSPAAPTGAADSVTMPVQDIISGELIVADDMAFEATPSPVAAPEQMIAPNPVTITPAFSQPASEAAYSSNAMDDEDGLSGLEDGTKLILAGLALWWILRKK